MSPAQHAVPVQQLAPHSRDATPAHTQAPLVQVLPSGQALPHAPQFEASDATARHAPAQQASPARHATPHAPQCAALVFRSKQPSTPDGVQSVSAAELHAQAPPAQRVFPGDVQDRPQVPQFCGSTARSVHVPCAAHVVAWPGSKQPQAPPLHASNASSPHAVAQSPQWAASRERSRHHGQGSAAQCSAGPFGHTQAPAAQLPVPQDRPQPPQWSALVSVSAQAPPQQVVPAAQTFPQPPQLDGSESGSTHRSPHLTWETGHGRSSGGHPTATARARIAKLAGRARFTRAMIDRRRSRVHPRGRRGRAGDPAASAERGRGPC